MSPVIKSATPPRGSDEEDGREVVWTLYRGEASLISAVVVAYTDGVELELHVARKLRRRLRFFRDTGATDYAQRIEGRLLRRGYMSDRRKGDRAPAVLGAAFALVFMLLVGR